MRRPSIRVPRGVAAAGLLLLVGRAVASGHGPVFGLATPVAPQGGWSLDLAYMARDGTAANSSMQRTMVAYGLTPDVQLSLSVPALMNPNPRLPPARLTGLMPGDASAELVLAWRFHREGVEVGTRRETTLFVGYDWPTRGHLGTMRTASGGVAALAHGMASRSEYWWVGAGWQWRGEQGGDAFGDTFFYSLVWGYRPPRWRTEFPAPDWRLFLEVFGEVTGRSRLDGARVTDSGGHRLFVGPTTLGIYRDWAISGGIVFPVVQDVRGAQDREHYRVAINIAKFN